jgi:hypothetical protein
LHIYDAIKVVIPAKHIPRDVWEWVEEDDTLELIKRASTEFSGDIADRPYSAAEDGTLLLKDGMWRNALTGRVLEIGTNLEFEIMK